MSHIPIPETDILEGIFTAVNEINSSQGASLFDINTYLASTLGKVTTLERLQLKLNYAVDKGLLTKLDDGKYKISETSGSQFEEAEKLKMLSDELFSKFDTEPNKITETASKAKKAVKSIENAINERFDSENVTGKSDIKKESVHGETAQVADQEASTDKRNVMENESAGASARKEDTEVSLPQDDNKDGIKDRSASINIKIKETASKTKEALKSIKSAIDAGLDSDEVIGKKKIKETSRLEDATQAEDQEPDADKRNAMETECIEPPTGKEDAKVSHPEDIDKDSNKDKSTPKKTK